MDTARLRAQGRLPTFIVIGAPRAGTTSLARYLSAHPDIFMSRQKELYYFALHNHERGLDWYRSQFARAADERAVGEATPWYLYSKEAPARMAELLPAAKLIAILRNPIDRALSQYWYQRWRHPQPVEFSELVDHVVTLPWRDEHAWRERYFDVGLYQRQLEHVCSYYPRDSIHVLLLEDLVANPKETFAGVCRFLNVDDSTLPQVVGSQHNAARIRRWNGLHRRLKDWNLYDRAPRLGEWIDKRNTISEAYAPMDEAVRAKLLAWYAEPNAVLAEWLGRDLSAWSR